MRGAGGLNRDPARRRRRLPSGSLVPLAVLALTLVALAGTWASTEPTFEGGVAPEDPGASVNARSVPWQSLGEGDAVVALRGEGRHWLAFRAFRAGGPGTLRVRVDDQPERSVAIGPRPSSHLVGPFELPGFTKARIADSRPPPGAAGSVAGPVFVANAQVVSRPIVAMPGAGFWPTETSFEGIETSWLGETGTIEVLALPEAATRQAWVAFEVASVDHDRTLEVVAGGVTRRHPVPQRGDSRDVTVGPIPLRDGRGSITLRSPDPVTYGIDVRARSVAVRSIAALARPPSP